MSEYDELKAKFLRAYANLPVPERSQVVAVVEEKHYSWDVAYLEVSNETSLGKKIIQKMKLVGIL